MKIILASNNKGKIREFQALLSDYQIELIPQAEMGVEEVEETGSTFIENAILKARHASFITGLPALADDSGLTVSALNGAPGICSARYAGQHKSTADNIDKLLNALSGIPEDSRQAAFYCVLVLIAHANDPIPLVRDGRWSGRIITAPRGNNGFGYDPVFFVPSEGKTSAELSSERKNELSHRHMAIQSLLQSLPEKLNECAIRTKSNKNLP